MVSLLRSFVLIVIFVFRSKIWKVKFKIKKNGFFLKSCDGMKVFCKNGYFKRKLVTRKVICLSYCSLMNCTISLGEVKREVFLGIKRSMFCFEE